MAVNDVFQSTIKILVDDRNIGIGTYWRQIEGADDDLICRFLSSALIPTVIAKLAAMLSSDATVSSIYTRRIQPIPAITDDSNLTGVVGARPAGMMPPNTAYITRLSSNDADLEASGRLYIAGWSKSDVVQGQLSAALLAGAANDWEIELKADQEYPPDPTFKWECGIWSTQKNGVPRPVPVFFPLDQAAVIPLAFRQTRRRSKRTDKNAEE